MITFSGGEPWSDDQTRLQAVAGKGAASTGRSPEAAWKGVDRPPVVRKVFSNGLTLLVQEDRSHPLVAFHAVIPTGSSTEGEFLGTGISHVLEHMLFKGTQSRPVGALEREARSYGGTTQGFTTYDTTSFQVVVNREFWSEGADLLVDPLFFPSMDAEEFAKEKGVVLRELKLRRDDPAQIAWDLLFSHAYRRHPYRIPIIGYEPLIQALTVEDVKRYHRLHYHPNTIVISVVGDVQAEAVIRRMEELTSKIPPGRVPLSVLPREPLPIGPQEVTEFTHAKLALIAIGFPSVSVDHPDVYALDLLAWLLGGGRGSQMDQALKETGLVHSVSAWNYTPRSAGLFGVTMRADSEQVSAAVEGVFREITKAQSKLFDPKEVQAAKKTLLWGYLQDRQTMGGQASDLAIYEVLVADPAFSYRYLEGIERVKLADLKRVALEYLKLERATTVKVFPEAYEKSVRKPSLPVQPEQVVKKTVLVNGLTVLFKRDPKLPLVNLQVSMLAGVRMETDSTNGISSLTSQMLLRGTRNKSAEQLTDEFRQMGAQLSPFSGRNSLGLSLSVVRSEFPRALRLVAEILGKPAFPLEELEKERRLALAALKSKEEDPFAWGMKRLSAILFTVHPYRLDPIGNAESLARLRRQDLVDFYAQVRNPKRMVVSVVGDFDEEEVLLILTSTLGDLPSNQTPLPVVAQEPRLEHLREHLEVTPRQEGLVMIGFHGLSVSDPRVPRLDLLDVILSGGAGRLFSEIREKRGLAYTVGAFSIHGVDPGSFVLYAVTEPANLELVRQALLEEIHRLRSTPIPQEELKEAKQGLLGGRRIARQTRGALASQMGLDELYGLGYDYPKQYEAAVLAARAEDLQKLAQELLDPGRIAVVIGQSQQEVQAASAAEGSKADPVTAVSSSTRSGL